MAGFIETLKGTSREHSYLGRMVPGQVINEDGYTRSPVTPHKDYFELRVPETFLRLERRYWKEYSPLTVVMLRFLHDGGIREIPFIISSQTMLASCPEAAQDWTEFYNVRALGPFPYEEGDVELAIALYAIETRDYAGEWFALADKLMNTLQVPIASHVFETADAIKGIIEQLTRLEKVSRKLGFYQAFQEDCDSPDRFCDQYLLKINAEEKQIKRKKLLIQDGRLHVQDSSGELHRITDWDYCLARIRASDKTSVTQLSFWETWKTVRRLVSEGNEHMSHSVYEELLRKITLCPDLTESDRQNLPFVFMSNYEDERARFTALHGDDSGNKLSGAGRYRDADSGSENGATGIEYSALKLRDIAAYPPQIHQGLKQISEEWGKIPGLGAAGNDHKLSSELIGQQLDRVRVLVNTEGIAPATIADALTIS